jgi:hypothetical protein
MRVTSFYKDVLPITALNADAFSRDEKARMYVSEASTCRYVSDEQLFRGPPARYGIGIYFPAPPLLRMSIEQRTARFAKCAPTDEDIRDGEIVSWRFVPAEETLVRMPYLTGWGVLIFND